VGSESRRRRQPRGRPVAQDEDPVGVGDRQGLGLARQELRRRHGRRGRKVVRRCLRQYRGELQWGSLLGLHRRNWWNEQPAAGEEHHLHWNSPSEHRSDSGDRADNCCLHRPKHGDNCVICFG